MRPSELGVTPPPPKGVVDNLKRARLDPKTRLSPSGSPGGAQSLLNEREFRIRPSELGGAHSPRLRLSWMTLSVLDTVPEDKVIPQWSSPEGRQVVEI